MTVDITGRKTANSFEKWLSERHERAGDGGNGFGLPPSALVEGDAFIEMFYAREFERRHRGVGRPVE